MILRTGRRKLAEVSEEACKLHIVADHADNLIPFAEKTLPSIGFGSP
jgi:hypothetical protein